MAAKPLGDRIGTERLDEVDNEAVRSVFRHESPVARIVEEGSFRLQTERPVQVATGVVLLFVVLMIGFILGGGFSSSAPAAVPADGGLFISDEQANEYQQQAIDLEESLSTVAVLEGEAAFMRGEMATLAEVSERLRRSLTEARLEMAIIVSIYEECVERLYPLECIESARPKADAFLAELYVEVP